MKKLMLVMIMKEMKTPKTMVRYRFKIFGLFWVKSRFLVFAIPEEEAMEEELPREDTLADIPPLLTAFSSVSDLV